MRSESTIPVAVIGAGPYGLSIAAHLAGRGVPFRIFGHPMAAWREQMPKHMFLKSEGHASSLSDPEGEFSLEEYCRVNGRPYRHFGLPIPIDLFIDYGMAFQRRYAPYAEAVSVTAVRRSASGFDVRLQDGGAVTASRVVVALGCDPFRSLPSTLASLSPDLVSHSADHHDFTRFSGKRVIVVGAGAGATDVAAALDAVGADARLVSRAPRLNWVLPRTDMPRFESLEKLDVLKGGRYGQGYIYSQLPHLYRHLPGRLRTYIARTYLGPRGGWPVRERVEKLPNILGARIAGTREVGASVSLDLVSADGTRLDLTVDHVIAATGYHLDVDRMNILSPDIRQHLARLDGGPELSAKFESSVPGLYFAGYSALYSFGPLMRFVAGADFGARRISDALSFSLASRVSNLRRKPASRVSLRTYAAPERE